MFCRLTLKQPKPLLVVWSMQSIKKPLKDSYVLLIMFINFQKKEKIGLNRLVKYCKSVEQNLEKFD